MEFSSFKKSFISSTLLQCQCGKSKIIIRLYLFDNGRCNSIYIVINDLLINFNDIVLIFQSFVYIIKQRGDKVNEDKKLNLDIGKRIYERRRQAGITQERLAELADTTPQAISNYERGERELLD